MAYTIIQTEPPIEPMARVGAGLARRSPVHAALAALLGELRWAAWRTIERARAIAGERRRDLGFGTRPHLVFDLRERIKFGWRARTYSLRLAAADLRSCRFTAPNFRASLPLPRLPALRLPELRVSVPHLPALRPLVDLVRRAWCGIAVAVACAALGLGLLTAAATITLVDLLPRAALSPAPAASSPTAQARAADRAAPRAPSKVYTVALARPAKIEGTVERDLVTKPGFGGIDTLRQQVSAMSRDLAYEHQARAALLARIAARATVDIQRAETVLRQLGFELTRFVTADALADIGNESGTKLGTVAGSASAPKAMLETAAAQGGPLVPISTVDGLAGAGRATSDALADIETQLALRDTLVGALRRLPLAVPLDYYWVSSRYGRRRDPFTKNWAQHTGLDMATQRGASVRASAPGTVRFVGWKQGYGKIVEIDHGNGVSTRFAHLAKILVKKGQAVVLRDKVGRAGSTGRSTGPHLHYEVLVDDRSRDPMPFLETGRFALRM